MPQFAPDAIIEYFNLPGLSEKDLHVTLVSKGVNVPIIVLSRLGTEEDMIQTFRLGAFDCSADDAVVDAGEAALTLFLG